ncbi:MAG TPA: hypothetical protein VLN90_05060, partial [Thioalkalivibrio sp.]|nr:hypothetical protein [Thioalkalivibrio sp.]
KAQELGAEFNWELETVYGVGHSGQKMAVAGARYLLAGQKERALFPLGDDSRDEGRGGSREKNELLQGSGAEDDPFADMD